MESRAIRSFRHRLPRYGRRCGHPERHDRGNFVSQPIDDLALSFIAPLSTNDDYATSHIPALFVNDYLPFESVQVRSVLPATAHQHTSIGGYSPRVQTHPRISHSPPASRTHAVLQLAGVAPHEFPAARVEVRK